MRHPHNKHYSPTAGTQVGIVLDEPPATVSQVVGYNPAYDAWIVRAEWRGRQYHLPIFFRDLACGWAERVTVAEI